MLTPAKIKNHHFEASGRNAYKAESVDTFFEEVADSYEQMFRENGEMYKKIGLLAERLEEYRKDENNIRNALLTAQRMAEKITREAQESADNLVGEAAERAKTENARVDAITADRINKAEAQAAAIVAEAQAQAEKMIYDATYESKAAAVSARDAMIKEEAALEMMKAEVTKFKTQILASYNEQLALIEQLPEIVRARIDEEKAAQAAQEEAPIETEETVEEPEVEVEVEVETEIEPEIAEETAVDVEPEEIPADAEPVEAAEPAADASAIDVDQLIRMIDDTVDTDIEDEPVEAEPEEEEEEVPFTGEYVLPAIDEPDDIVEKLSEEISNSEPGDIVFSEVKKNREESGFKVNIGSIPAYENAIEIDDDELDDFDDDDDNGGFSSKLKGFFRK